MPSAVLKELGTQGWLPTTTEGLRDWSPLTIGSLGQALGREAPAVFVLILTHVLALALSAGAAFPDGPSGETPFLLATSPYWNFSKVASPVRLERVNGEWVLNGQVPLVINAKVANWLLVPAQTLAGDPAICRVSLTEKGVAQSAPIALLGLRGAAARNVELTSATITEQNLICDAVRAHAIIDEAYFSATWGVVGLLAGLVCSACEQARSYANLRVQGGRHIIDHLPVRRLIEAADSVKEQFGHWLDQAGPAGKGSTVPLDAARKHALLATDAALQVFGGSGYICPGEPERFWRDTRQAATLFSVTACPGDG
jgi:alkylation response protein AidB-like acyl-CoA dehydrogenase